MYSSVGKIMSICTDELVIANPTRVHAGAAEKHHSFAGDDALEPSRLAAV
jgi:hypothetical protein